MNQNTEVRNDGKSDEPEIPSDVRNAITVLKDYFAESVHYCDKVLSGKQYETELDYLIRDHNDEPHNRNQIIANHVKTLREFQNVLEGYDKYGNAISDFKKKILQQIRIIKEERFDLENSGRYQEGYIDGLERSVELSEVDKN